MMPVFGVRREVIENDAIKGKEKGNKDFVRGSTLLMKRPTSTGVSKHLH